MNAIRSVFAAFTNLAASINALASVIDLATDRLRQQLALDSEPLVLPHDSDTTSSNGSTKRGRSKANG
jgi:hypothetical protein